MPATARTALTQKARAAGRTAAEASTFQAGRLWAEVLAELPLFAGMSARQVRRVARLGRAARFEAHTPIVEEGEPGEAFYVILSGRAEVRRRRKRAAAELGPGAYFGEMALLDGAPRSATVVAKRETVCLVLPRRGFAKLLKDEPAIASALLRTLAARVRDLEASQGSPGEP
jgi:CRP/FNR family transcriptional regulator, cyclic AMP receptor protein